MDGLGTSADVFGGDGGGRVDEASPLEEITLPRHKPPPMTRRTSQERSRRSRTFRMPVAKKRMTGMSPTVPEDRPCQPVVSQPATAIPLPAMTIAIPGFCFAQSVKNERHVGTCQ